MTNLRILFLALLLTTFIPRCPAASVDDLIAQASDEGIARALTVIDSLESAHALIPSAASYHRGDCCLQHAQLRSAIMHYKRALASDELLKSSPLDYYLVHYNLSVAQLNTIDVNGALHTLTAGYNRAKKDTAATVRDYANKLLMQIGTCQMRLGRKNEAAKTFVRAIQGAEDLAVAHDSASYYVISCLDISIQVINQYLNEHDYHQASGWIDTMEKWHRVLKRSGKEREMVDRNEAILDCNRAVVLYKTGYRKLAQNYYQRFLASDYANSYAGIYDHAYYLEVTEQWQPLLDVLQQIDTLERNETITPTIDYLIERPSTTFKALLKTGRRDEALHVAERIVNLLDTVRAAQQQNDAAELAVIFETQEKDAQIARQQASLSQQRLITGITVSSLVILALAIFILFRQRAARRLKVAHQQLQTAYDQLEETTTAKERIESELRIARDIQMSMVPSQFPTREGLDLYASMTPAKEVGGDLYDFLLNDDQLYFCVADVSGKGVPASLFMAQTVRLFRALAKQSMSAATIAMRLNVELSEGNDSSMFVTMFLGVVDLNTGKLTFCNAGHNPPVILQPGCPAQFITMKPNTPLGLWDGMVYEEEQIDSIKHCPLVIYTDGLNEAEDMQQQLFGDEQLLQLLTDEPFHDSRQTIDMLKTAVSRHRNGAEPNDDLTIMCIALH